MTTLQCFWLVATIATPPIIGMLLYILVQLINTYFIGNMDEPILLAGVGMGNMLINVLAFASIQGLNGALETLVSQAYGEEDYNKCGDLLNRGKFICTCFMIPIAVIFGLSERILVAI
jgi:multidrug resistance protein, MATE family